MLSRYIPADAGILCDKTAVFGASIKENHVVIKGKYAGCTV